MVGGELLLPVQSLLLHIGPHKTGTTAVQSAFHAARDRLAEFGVFYASRDRQPLRAVIDLTGKPPRIGEKPGNLQAWHALVEATAVAPEPRAVLSSEGFADGDASLPARVVADFPGRRAHVVVTLRAMSKILPSSWQQYVQNGRVTGYQRWLEQVLNEPERLETSQHFWRRHDHPALIRRWLDVVGVENLTVVVIDEDDPSLLMRTFEAFVGLPAGLLVPDLTNRSLTFGEVEMHRRLNEEFRDRGWYGEEYARFLRRGVMPQLVQGYTPRPAEPRIVTPPWAAARAADIGAATVEAINGMGVRVVGELSSLAAPPPADQPAPGKPVVSSKAAAQAVLGAVLAGMEQPDPPPSPPPPRPVSEIPSRKLLSILRGRAKRRIRSLVRRRPDE